MGKNRAEKRAAAAAAARGEAAPSKPAKSQWARYAALVALAAVGVQACIYFALSDREPGAGAGNSTRPARRAADAEPAVALHPPVCPPDWKRCPQLPGVDWPALLAAVPAPSELDADALAKCGATALLSPRDIKGMHVMCVLPPPPELAASTTALIAAYPSMRRRDGADGEPTPPTAVVPVPSRLSKEAHLVATIEYALRTPPKRSAKHQPAALFSKTGVRVRSVAGGLRQSALLLMEGGQWLWPPVDVGHVHIIADLTAPGVETRVVTASLRPLVLEVENFLSPTEAGHMVSRAKPHMAKSGVALKDADKGKAAKEFRTSSQYFLPTYNDAVLEAVDARVQALTRVPISHAEFIQVLRYEHMEHYSAHHDYFDPAAYASNPGMLESVEHGARNRLMTVFFYLTNVSKGGATNFPRAATARRPNGGPQPMDYFDCSNGISVYPREGKVIIFYSMHADGSLDEFSLHGGCDVLDPDEIKWSANFWLWNKPYQFNQKHRPAQTNTMKAQWL